MSTLLLRLAAPLQSWGSNSKFDRRHTDMEPTKSGVIGMLACALGNRREEPLGALADLQYGVRVDQEGEVIVDFHMVHEQSSSKNAASWVTRRYYLSDAVFLVAVEGPLEVLQKLELALKKPVFPIYLGRRSCPPTGKIVLGIREKNLQDALREELWVASDWYQKRIKKSNKNSLEIVRDALQIEKDGNLVRDVPLSFNQKQRKYGFRSVVREHIPLDTVCKDECVEIPEDTFTTLHDPMALLEEDNVSIEN